MSSGMLWVCGFVLFGAVFAWLPIFKEHQDWFPVGYPYHQHQDLLHDDVQFQEIDEGMRQDP